MVQLRIDEVGGYGTQYRFPNTKEEITVKVNGVEWEVQGNPGIGDGYSWIWLYSPEFQVTDDEAALGWYMPGLYADNCYVPDSYVNTPINPISIDEYTFGGEKPYSYSKVSGPSWLSVDSEGDIIGTPSAFGSNDPLIVRITDNAGAYKDISININKTNIRPEDRTVIREVQGTVEGGIAPTYGQMCDYSVITAPDDAPYYYSFTMGNWWKLGDEYPERMPLGDTFDEGQYYYQIQGSQM